MSKHGISDRIYYLDNLRVLAMAAVFSFHSAMFFVSWRWHIDNAESSFFMDSFVRFIHLWIMPLFFVLSGAAAQCSLRVRTGAQYLTERFRRLIIPLFTGIAAVVPLQVYLERVSRSEFSGSFFEFYFSFFIGFYPEGNFTLNHLWFLPCLFVFSLLAILPGRLMVKARMRLRYDRLIQRRDIWIFCVPLLPFIVIEGTLRYSWPFYLCPADLLIFFCYFLCGYLLVTLPAVSDAIKRYSAAALASGIAAFTVITVLYAMNRVPAPDSSWRYVLFHLCWTITGWFWVAAIVGLGMKHLAGKHKLLSAANEAVLPAYVLHQTVILFNGYYVVQWDMSILLKYSVILTTSLIITGLLYAMIRQSDTARLLFGLSLNTRHGQPAHDDRQYQTAPYYSDE